MTYYLVTLARHQVKDFVDHDYLKDIIRNLDKQHFDIKHYALERHGKYKQLHAHMLVKVNKYFKYQSYVKAVDGFIMHFRKITKSLKNVIKYIYKHIHPHDPNHVRLANYFNNHYLF